MKIIEYMAQSERVEIYSQSERVEIYPQKKENTILYRNDITPEDAWFFNLPRSFFTYSSLWIQLTEAGDAVVTESNDVLKQIVHFLSTISEVTVIYLMRDADNSIQICTLADPLDDRVLDSIFDQELKIIQYFKGSFSLDFHVAPLSDEEFFKNRDGALIYKRG
ncbi:MAG: hypothetical protein Q8P40_06140 [Nitrospirota bacterium]|nr:hypothetical protein [Nitrospirota bacterium]